MRIGISVLTHANQSIWENGIGQNVIFFAQALQEISFVTSVVLIDVGDQGKMPAGAAASQSPFQLFKQEQAADLVDVIIEFAGALDAGWLALQRVRGKKIVYYCCGHPYAGVVESAVFQDKGHFFKAERCDEVWVIPEYAMFAPFQRVVHRCPVHVVPYLWSPLFLEQRIEEVRQHGYHFGWKSQEGSEERSALKVAIFEPNISVTKTSMVSMLACDEACRAEPGSIEMMHVLNTLHMKDHPTMLHLANSLDLVKTSRACFHGRHDIVGFMAQFANAVVSHQWTNDQNYSYMDVLYGDYPLIHNSAWLNGFGAGYYYEGFDSAAGGRQLLEAWKHHDELLADQRRAKQKLFDALNPVNPANVQAYAQLLTQLCSDNAELMEQVS